MRVVVLVPRRSGEFHRDRSWVWVRDRWAREHPDWPVVEGDHDLDGTPFNRSRAINRAAALAGDWDVAVIADSDSVVDAGRLRDAVGSAARSGRMTLGFSGRAHVRQAMTETILAGGPGPWDGHDPIPDDTGARDAWMVRWGVADILWDHWSGMNAVPRTLWDTVGGFDEGFAAPGAEDTAFNVVATDVAGGRDRVPGILWHLWHPIRPESTPENTERLGAYLGVHLAGGDLAAYRALRSEVHA